MSRLSVRITSSSTTTKYVRFQPPLGHFRLLFSLQLPHVRDVILSLAQSACLALSLLSFLPLNQPLLTQYLNSLIPLFSSSPESAISSPLESQTPKSKKYTTASSLFLAPPQLTNHVQLRRQQHCKFGFCTPTNPLSELTIKESGLWRIWR